LSVPVQAFLGTTIRKDGEVKYKTSLTVPGNGLELS